MLYVRLNFRIGKLASKVC